MQLVPQVENDRTTMVGSSIQPITNGIFVNLQDTTGCSNGISFGQGTDGHLENHWFAFQTIVGGGITQGDTPVTSLTQSLRLTITGTIFDHPALPKGNTVVFTAFVRTIKCFPIHFCTLDQHLLCFRGYADISYFHYLIKENEGQHPEPQAAIIAVKDRGPGLPEAELEHIFSKFFRLNPGGIGGTGLGLSIARGIVEAHNGRIWAQNRPGGGAVFLMALPLAKVEALIEN